MQKVFSTEDRSVLLGFVGAGGAAAERRRRLENRMMDAAALFNADLHYARTPTLASTKAGVSRLRDQLAKASELLDSLDYSGRKALSDAADNDAIGGRLSQTDGPRFEVKRTVKGKPLEFRQLMGEPRLNAAADGMKDLLAWADSVIQLNDDDEVKEQAKRAEAIRDCIRKLITIWKDGWGKRPESNPTPKTFTPFVRAVLNPIMARHGKVDDLARAISDALYK